MIYVLKAGETEHYKLGVTRDGQLFVRLQTLQAGNPLLLRVIALKFDGGQSEEKALHFKMKQWRLCGEWFSPNRVLARFVEENPFEGGYKIPGPFRNARYESLPRFDLKAPPFTASIGEHPQSLITKEPR